MPETSSRNASGLTRTAVVVWRVAGVLFAAVWVATVVAFPWVKGLLAAYVPVVVGLLVAVALLARPVRSRLTRLLVRPSKAGFLAMLLPAALLVRLAWIPYFPAEPAQDPGYYHANAVRLLQGQPYGDPGRRAHYPPGESLLLVAVYSLTGPTPLAGQVASCLLGVLLVFLVYAAARLALPELVARWSAVLAAAMPTLWFASVSLGYETLLACLLLGACLSAVRAARTRGPASWGWSALMGLLLGYGALVKPICLLVPLLCAAGWIVLGAARRAPAYLLVCLVVMAACIAPWTWRNTRVFDGRFVLISTNAGEVLWAANNPRASGGYMPHQPLPGETGELSRDRLGRQAAVRWIREHPGAFARLAVRKAVFTWGTSSTVVSVLSADRMSPTRERLAQAAANTFWAMLCVLAVVGLLRSAVWTRPALLAVHLLVLYVFALHLLFEFHSRHHIPVVASLLLLAGGALAGRAKQAEGQTC